MVIFNLEDDSVSIQLPPANPKLHAHNTGHWRAKSSAVKSLRRCVKELCILHKPREFKRFEKAIVHYGFFLPDNRRRDAANLIQSQKPAIDGVVDAEIIVDDCWQMLRIGNVNCQIDRDDPCVILTFVREMS